MKWLLNILYATALLLLSPVILWRMLRHGRYRAGWREKLLGQLSVPDDTRPRIWFHAVSVGEVVQLEKVVRAFQTATNDQFSILVTTSTDTGHQLACERLSDFCVTWLPLDFSWAVSRAVTRVQPEMLVLMELELWPNLLTECGRQNTPTAVVNARMSDRSFRGYRKLSFLRSVFAGISVVAAQSEQYANRLRLLGVPSENVTISGSIKFDGLMSDRQNGATNQLRDLFGINKNETVLIAGSTQAPEEQMAVHAWQSACSHSDHIRLIIVPRHRERFEQVASDLRAAGCRVTSRSEIQTTNPPEADEIIILDTIGELAACWGLADVAFVGGSFGPRNGQNMLEPAAYGAAIVVGPRTSNFRDIVSLLKDADAIVQVANEAEFQSSIINLLTAPESRSQKGQRAASVVAAQKHALSSTIDLLTAELSSDKMSCRAA